MNTLSLPSQDPKHVEPHPLSVSVEHGAKLLGIGRTSMWACVSAGLVQVFRLSKRTLIPYTELENLMARPQAEIDEILASYRGVVEGRKLAQIEPGIAPAAARESKTRVSHHAR